MATLYPSEDRLPAYLGIPSSPEERIGPVARPWGVTRMKSYKTTPEPPQVLMTRMELDPRTQLTVRYDTTGQPIEAGKHRKTYQGTETSTTTAPPGDGQDGTPDEDFEQDSNEVD